MAIPYCNDVDCFLQAAADFPELCPASQELARGVDGVLPPGGWALSAASTNFLNQGVLPASPAPAGSTFEAYAPVILLSGGVPSIGTNVGMQVVATNLDGSATLARPGLAAGQGSAPGGASGRTGVAYLLRTLAPQIEWASYELNRRYGVDDVVLGRRAVDQYDPRELRLACTFLVLYRQYEAMARESKDDTFARKSDHYKEELDDLLGRVAVRWLPSYTQGTDDVATRFGMRLVR
jgi:hypothetical protein